MAAQATATVTAIAVTSNDVTLAQKGDETTISVAANADVSVAGDVTVELWRAGDASAVEAKSVAYTVGTGQQGTVSFVVSEPGVYYAVAGGVSSLDNSGATYQNAVVKAGTAADSSDWASGTGYTFDYNVEKANGAYTVTGDEQIWVEQVTDVFGNEVDDTTYGVVYLKADGTIVPATDAVNGRAGGFPEAVTSPASFQIAVVQGDLTNVNIEALQNLDGLRMYVGPTHVDTFTLRPDTVSLEGATAFEWIGQDTDEQDGSDTEFMYTGNTLKVGVMAGGKAVTSNGYTAAIKTAPLPDGATASSASVTAAGYIQITNPHAGEYVVTIVGDGKAYSGTYDLTFTVDKLDLSAVEVTAPDFEAAASSYETNPETYFKADGQKVAASTIVAAFFSYTAPDGTTQLDSANPISDMSNPGTYVYKVTPAASTFEEDICGEAFPEVGVYSALAEYYYGSDQIVEGTANAPFETFVTSLGEAFNPNSITVTYDDTTANASRHGFTATVEDSEGNVVTDYSQAGVYKLTLTAEEDGSFEEGGTVTAYFKVLASHITAGAVNAYAAIDGKMLSATATGFPYKAAAYDYDLIVKEKDGGATVDPSLYEVELTDAETGEAVEAIQEVGSYEIQVSIDGTDVPDDAFKVEVTKAELVAAKANADFFALPADGSAASPAFTANTEADFKGLSLELTDENSDVVYWNADMTEKVAAEDLTEAGDYVAEITVLSTEPSFETPDPIYAAFKVSKTAVYADVDANAWYAESVYKAAEADYGYMTGIPGTNLFLPEGTITRAQSAQVLYNMAGGKNDTGYYPTQFSDVDPEAWYALPVLWASEAGIVTGMGDTGTFAPDQNVTREQAATMLWRYMKAQGKDVSGSADLAAYADGSSVSGWAAEAMAWAVDAEVFGVGTDVLRPADTLTRAEMAAISVRVQPDGAIERS